MALIFFIYHEESKRCSGEKPNSAKRWNFHRFLHV